jgi:hypothetical protein
VRPPVLRPVGDAAFIQYTRFFLWIRIFTLYGFELHTGCTMNAPWLHHECTLDAR